MSAWHFNFLCPKKFSDPPSNIRKIPNHYNSRKTSSSIAVSRVSWETVSNIIVTNCYQEGCNLDFMLGTFSCVSGTLKLRGLRDSGSQNYFNLESKLTPSNHRVLEKNIYLTVNGINESKVYSSKLVEIDLDFRGSFKAVQFLTLPTINISLSLPNLPKIVREFVNKGYTLADDFL